MIEIRQLSKSYDEITALNEVSFDIGKGEIVGLLGPNGAGKTTLIKIMTGYLHPDGGSAQINGRNVMEETLTVQQGIGYLPENAPVYPELTVQAYLSLMAELHKISPADQGRSILDAVKATGLADRLTQRIGTLSKGYRQRVGIAQAIMHKPALLIFDEPTVGLDPTQIVEIRSLIRTLAQNSTILFSTHILAEVEALCDRVLILLNGELRADSVMEELRDTNGVILVLKSDVPRLKPILAQIPTVQTVTRQTTEGTGLRYRIEGERPDELSSVIYQTSREHGWPVREIYNEVTTLESRFNALAMARQDPPKAPVSTDSR